MGLKMKCKTCNGYGFHSMGDCTPMGRIDASDGYPTVACPECGANPNPIKKTNTNILKSKINHPVNQMTREFMEIFEKMGVTFIDVTDKIIKSSKEVKCPKKKE